MLWMPVYFTAEYMGIDECQVRWLMSCGELDWKKTERSIVVSEWSARKWMRKHGIPLSDDPEPEQAEPEPAPVPTPCPDATLPRPPKFLFGRIDDELFALLVARAHLRTGTIPKACPRCCPGWLADKDCLEGKCIYYYTKEETDE